MIFALIRKDCTRLIEAEEIRVEKLEKDGYESLTKVFTKEKLITIRDNYYKDTKRYAQAFMFDKDMKAFVIDDSSESAIIKEEYLRNVNIMKNIKQGK